MRTKTLFPIMVALTVIVLLGCPNSVIPQTDTVINIVAIPGVTAPVLGATPVTAITETVQYTGTVAWNGTPSTFAAITVYTATITLSAKAGFTLTGVAANSFSVAGAIATNAVNSGVVTAVFPATGAAPATVINLSAIPGLTAPVTGVAPVTKITETSQYTGTVSWSPAVTSNFVAHTAYSATISLTPKSGYTLNGVGSNSFSISGANNVTNTANSGTISAFFNQTGDAKVPLELLIPSGVYNGAQIDSLYVGKYELTQSEYTSLIDGNPSKFNSDGLIPVNGCTPLEAMIYCNQLSNYKGYSPVYTIIGTVVTADFSKNGYRLPTLKEWLYIANSGDPANESSYSGSADANSVAWYAGNSGGTPHEVGLKNANSFGLFDTSGNVMEYCWDGISSIFDECGGSWEYNDNMCFSVRTDGGPIGANNSNFGFRTVRNSN